MMPDLVYALIWDIDLDMGVSEGKRNNDLCLSAQCMHVSKNESGVG